MSSNEVIEGLPTAIGRVQCVIPILWVTYQPSHDIIIKNNFQRLHFPCSQTISQIIFTTNGHLVPIDKLNTAYTHQKIEFTCS